VELTVLDVLRTSLTYSSWVRQWWYLLSHHEVVI